MFQYRAVLVRLRQGDSDRDIARARLMGRPKVAALRALAAREGWLAPDTPLPEDGVIAVVIGQARRARSTISTVEPFRAIVARWAEQGVNGVAIHAALCREHGYSGSYSAVRRMLGALAASRPPEATVRLQFAPATYARLVAPERQRQQLARLREALEALDRDEAVDRVELLAQAGGQLEVRVGVPFARHDFEDDGDHAVSFNG